jgi:hypothetical protein
MFLWLLFVIYNMNVDLLMASYKPLMLCLVHTVVIRDINDKKEQIMAI